MEVQIKLTIRPGCEITFKAENPINAVHTIAYYQEALGGYVCGNCSLELGSFENPPRYVHRSAKGQDGGIYDYYSIECPGCQFRMDLGQHNQPLKGCLFAKPDKGPKSNGWYDWREFSKRQGGEQGQTPSAGQTRPVDDKELAEFT